MYHTGKNPLPWLQLHTHRCVWKTCKTLKKVLVQTRVISATYERGLHFPYSLFQDIHKIFIWPELLYTEWLMGEDYQECARPHESGWWWHVTPRATQARGWGCCSRPGGPSQRAPGRLRSPHCSTASLWKRAGTWRGDGRQEKRYIFRLQIMGLLIYIGVGKTFIFKINHDYDISNYEWFTKDLSFPSLFSIYFFINKR